MEELYLQKPHTAAFVSDKYEKTFLYIGIGLTGIAVIIFSATLIRSLWYAPEETHAPNVAAVTAAQSSAPSRLIIPKLQVNAAVQRTGLNVKGAMGVPTNFTDVAWYQYGTPPGEKGSAVIDGHVDNGLGLDGVFKHLGDLKIGDEIDIQTKNGDTLRFEVSDIQSYLYTEVPNDTIFNRSDTARLNLITCEGGWVKGKNTYDHRLVVFASLSS